MSLWGDVGGSDDNDDDNSTTANTGEILALSDTVLSVFHVLTSEELMKTELLLFKKIFKKIYFFIKYTAARDSYGENK